ncbi:MAG: type I-U CRISPR-associated helicase/endonuclease Cas3 [Actinobacteria bacterium]|nr:type I-U CRISPR-associated helicase/endonuclease Cas3 [Actinomycetota bacterium]
MRLDPAKFDTWFECLNGCEPFPWQRRLFREWLCPEDPAKSRWPRLIGLPTASGKTSLIDLAVLALAAGSECARRRIAFVVDRRVVVDEASERAAFMAKKLEEALRTKRGPLHEVAKALLALGGDKPLIVATLRGGIVPDEDWSRTPTQPAVIVSTVDQLGSRLLFRSYGGHGPRSWPIQAGLLGRDTLIIVDEAHCAVPFCETLRSISEYWQRVAEVPLGKPLLLVTMTATPLEKADFSLSKEDRHHPELGKRLKASKPARLVEAKGAIKAIKHGKAGTTLRRVGNSTEEEMGKETLPYRADLVAEIVELTEELLDSGKHRVVGIVVNRVADARAIYGKIVEMGKEALLLTGRVREWDRRKTLEEWLPRIRAGLERDIENPVAVVATQCIEVGANIDFDALITEVAPLDALRQRFGRLNRLGRHEHCKAYIVATQSQVALASKRRKGKGEDGAEAPTTDIFSAEAKERDPIYGHALLRTWLWLNKVAKRREGEDYPLVDFGLGKEYKLSNDQLQSLCQERNHAHPLLPAHIDLLVQTNPRPEPDPEISAFLHGTVSNNSDVTVVWRMDLKMEDLTRNPKGIVWLERVGVQPPAVGEGCPVPIWEFKNWMAGMVVQEGGDIESIAVEGKVEGSGSSGLNRSVVRWRGPEEAEVITARDVRPGDVVVVPSAYGGLDDFGWNPRSSTMVLDIGDVVSAEYRKPVLRLEAARENLRFINADEEVIRGLDMLRSVAVGEEVGLDVRESLEVIGGMPTVPEWLRRVIERLVEGIPMVVEAGGSLALIGRKGPGYDAYTYGNEAFTGKRVNLEEHSDGVREWISEFCHHLGFDDGIKKDMELAAAYHDLGKADIRFQVWLYGGNEIDFIRSGELLAKSPMIARDSASRERARKMSKYPKGGRHEAQSVALISGNQALMREAADYDLVLHLVISHHGYGRPFVPFIEDENPVWINIGFKGQDFGASSDHRLYELSSGVAERYWRLVRKYGWWGLAYLEAVFRLADQRRSELEQER